MTICYFFFFVYLIIDPSHQMSGFRNAEGFASRYLLTQFAVYAPPKGPHCARAVIAYLARISKFKFPPIQLDYSRLRERQPLDTNQL